MAYSLARENDNFIKRMVRRGRFNNQSEVIREALRRMEREETAYLNPPPLTETEAKNIYQPNREEEAREEIMSMSALRAIRKTRRGK